MKTNKTVSLDLEVVIKLRELKENVSDLVNSFLKEYLNLDKTSKKTRKEVVEKEIIKQEALILKKKELLEQLNKDEIKRIGVPFKLK